MKKFEIEIEKVNGYCEYGYKMGDRIEVDGYTTPGGFCGGAYCMLFPVFFTLSMGGRFDFEKNPRCKTKLACPDNGNIVFKVTQMD